MLRALDRAGLVEGALTISYRRRHEAQNCFVTPALLREYARLQYADMDLFGGHQAAIDEVLDALVLEHAFDGVRADFDTWRKLTEDAAQLVWVPARPSAASEAP